MSSRLLRSILLTFFGFILIAAAFFCNSPVKPVAENPHPDTKWRNVYDTNAHYVGMQTCRGCHESVYQTFIQTGMGQSLDLPGSCHRL